MKVLGINLEIKKAPKRDLSEQIRILSEICQDMEKRIQANYRASEALRKRFERAKIQENGNEELEAAFQGPDQPGPADFRTGDPWPG